MINLFIYCTFLAAVYGLALREYLQKMDELNNLNSQLLRLQTEQSALLSEISKQGAKIDGIVTTSSTNNNVFYLLIGLGVVVVLVIGYIYVSSTPNNSISEIVAKEMPEIAKVSGDSILEGIKAASTSLGDKLNLMDSNVEKLSETAVMIGIRCSEIESKIGEILVKLSGENIPADIITHVAQNGVFT